MIGFPPRIKVAAERGKVSGKIWRQTLLIARMMHDVSGTPSPKMCQCGAIEVLGEYFARSSEAASRVVAEQRFCRIASHNFRISTGDSIPCPPFGSVFKSATFR